VKYPRGDRIALTTYGLTTTLRHYDIESLEYTEGGPIFCLKPRPDDSLSVVTARLPGYETEPKQYNKSTREIEEELQTKIHREIDRVDGNEQFEVSTELLHRFFRIVRITNAVVPTKITTAGYEIEIEDRENGPPRLDARRRQI
jgi:CRISPR-associated endonuclease/helicase Cas3